MLQIAGYLDEVVDFPDERVNIACLGVAAGTGNPCRALFAFAAGSEHGVARCDCRDDGGKQQSPDDE